MVYSNLGKIHAIATKTRRLRAKTADAMQYDIINDVCYWHLRFLALYWIIRSIDQRDLTERS